VEHELGRPDVVTDYEAVAPLEGSPPGSDFLPGGLYDDEAVVFADTSDLVDDDTAAELDTVAELDIDTSMLDTIEAELAAVERALALLDEGTYGQCEHCGRAIDDDVLDRAPTTRFCAEHLPLSLP
jgi:RNA polymerase-binding transcription factor DksA